MSWKGELTRGPTRVLGAALGHCTHGRCHGRTARVLLCLRLQRALNLHGPVTEPPRKVRMVSINFNPWNSSFFFKSSLVNMFIDLRHAHVREREAARSIDRLCSIPAPTGD